VRFSARSSVDLAQNRLAEALDSARALGRTLLDLTVSNPTAAGIPYDETAILGAVGARGALLYEPAAFGIDSARQAVARDLSEHGPAVDPRRVVLTASTSEAYAFLFKLLCDPGDEVLVPRPSYPLFEHLARLESVRAVPYPLRYDGAWHVDLPALAGAVSRRARAIVTVSPNNPTGSYVKAGEYAAMASHGLPIVSDDVFAHYDLRAGSSRPSVLETPDAALVFSLGGLSKLAALPQMKLAWTVVGGEAARVADALARLEVIADSFLSVGAPVQHALPSLLASRAVAEGAIVQRTRENLAHVAAAIRGTPASVLDVEGGWYATLRLPRTRDEETWVLDLLEKDGVHVHPGHFFDFEDEAFVVVSLLTPTATLREGVARIVARLAEEA
jgi:aspartate/methionine/tyrosine aminotransferase